MIAHVSRPVFDRIKRRALRVRRVKSYFGKWDCMKGCFTVKNPYKEFAPFLQAVSDEKVLMYEGAGDNKRHIYTRYNQRQSYRDTWESLSSDDILVAQDFGMLTLLKTMLLFVIFLSIWKV